MARSSRTDRARDRTLTDDEIRALWPVFEKRGNFGKACQFMLLTGGRLSPTIDMTWTEISEDGATWSIPSARSMTQRDMVFPLSTAAQAIIAGQPRKGPRVFPSKNGRRASGGHEKKRIDELAPGLEHWTIHDLRHTALSLLSRAGVWPDIAARVLGHVAGGDVDSNVYDRHTYMDEKRDAVDLAVLVERILNADAVVPLRRG
jgi:integrase